MDFAKNLLTKYGWKEGQGIGKNSDGILKPIKASLKFDNAGLGHDRSKEFTDHWWEKSFNDAASRLKITSDEEKIGIHCNTETISPSFDVGQKTGYVGNFCTAAIENSNSDIEEMTGFKMALTDEDLLKACGGRTAHKGARHGLSLNGKLSRIEAQERQMLEAHNSNNEFDANTAQDTFNQWIEVKKKKKKNKKGKKTNYEKWMAPIDSPDKKLAALIDQNDYVIRSKSKKSKKKQRAREEDLSKSFSALSTSNEPTINQPSVDLRGISDASKAIKKLKSSRKMKKSKLKRELDKLSPAEVPAESIVQPSINIEFPELTPVVIDNCIEKYLFLNSRERTRAQKYLEEDKWSKAGRYINTKLLLSGIKNRLPEGKNNESDDSLSDERNEPNMDLFMEQILELMDRFPCRRLENFVQGISTSRNIHSQKTNAGVKSKSEKKRGKGQIAKISKRMAQAMSLGDSD